MIGSTLVRVGEINAAVRMTDHVIGPVETPAAVVVDQRLDLAVRAHSRESAIIAFTDDEPALQIERRAVAADRGADQFRLFAGYQPVEVIAAQIDEVPKPVGVPERAFGENKAGSKANGLRGFEHVGQLIGGRHLVPLFSRSGPAPAIARAMSV